MATSTRHGSGGVGSTNVLVWQEWITPRSSRVTFRISGWPVVEMPTGPTLMEIVLRTSLPHQAWRERSIRTVPLAPTGTSYCE